MAGCGAGYSTTCNPNVLTLQKSLKQFADARSYPTADPGTIDGIVGTKTLTAIIAIAPSLPKLPSFIKDALKFGPLLLLSDSTANPAKKLIADNASTINGAIVALQVYQTVTGSPPPPPPAQEQSPLPTQLVVPQQPGRPVQTYVPPPTTAIKQWYQTPTGMAAIAAGGLGALLVALRLTGGR